MKNILLSVSLLLATITSGFSQNIASSVKFYFYPVALPNSDNTTEFGTSRDNLLTGIKYGGKSFTTSGSRVGTSAGNVTAIEIKNVFDVSDMMVSTTVNLWRGQFNPPAPYNAQFGNRPYVAVLAIGQNGKVCLDRLSYKVSCGAIPLLGNNSSLAGLTYSVSRIGISAGPDGKLFTADDEIITSGSGTNLVDAIAFIGGRVGAVGNTQANIDSVNSAVGSGTWLRWDYYFTGVTNVSHDGITIPLYQSGQVPWVEKYNRIVPMVGPEGVLFSIVGQPGSAQMKLYGARKLDGPFTLLSTTAVEGTTAFYPFTRNSTNDFGFYRLVTNSIPQ